MKLGKATAEDFKIMWRVYKALNRMENSYLLDDSQSRNNRCKPLIVALLQELGTGFMRITMGAETLIEHCCDPDKSYLDFKPELTAIEKDQADAKRYQYLRNIEVMPLKVYEALENNMGETLDLEIDYQIGLEVANAVQDNDTAMKVKP